MRNVSDLQERILGELDQAKGPLKNENLCTLCQCSEGDLREAKKHLIRTGQIYVCQEGVILKEYATPDHQFWHLAWGLGLLEVSAIHVEMDRELLLSAPKQIKQLLADGRMRPEHQERLNRLRQQLVVAMTVPKTLLQLYHQVENILDYEEEEVKKLKEGVKTFKDFKDLKRALKR